MQQSRLFDPDEYREQRYARLWRLLARSKRPEGHSAPSSASQFSVFPSSAGSPRSRACRVNSP